MIMRMIKAMRVTGVNMMITIKLRIIRVARVTTIIIRIRISAMMINRPASSVYASSNIDEIMVNLLSRGEQLIIPVQTNNTNLITSFIRKMTPAQEKRLRIACENKLREASMSSSS